MEKVRSGFVLAGQRFGRWTVLDSCEVVGGERRWLCRCECGTERLVRERSLLSGGSKSCGCLTRENSKKAISQDLVGKVFGELSVLRETESPQKSGGVVYLCQCACGDICKVRATLLLTGRKTHCANKIHRKTANISDISGQKFYKLTAVQPTEKRDGSGSVVWLCRCECGEEIEVSYNALLYGNMRSCGCQKKAHEQKLHEFLTHVDGTSVDILKSKKIPSDNTTGCKGVYFIRGKYVAKLVFQKKAYYLGTFDNIEAAAQARNEAEKLICDGTADFYEKWKAKADADPQWASENPMKITVEKDADHGLTVSFLPAI